MGFEFRVSSFEFKVQSSKFKVGRAGFLAVETSHEPFLRTVAFRPLQRSTPESARKQPESVSENSAGSCFRAKGRMARHNEGEYPPWIFD